MGGREDDRPMGPSGWYDGTCIVPHSPKWLHIPGHTPRSTQPQRLIRSRARASMNPAGSNLPRPHHPLPKTSPVPPDHTHSFLTQPRRLIRSLSPASMNPAGSTLTGPHHSLPNPHSHSHSFSFCLPDPTQTDLPLHGFTASRLVANSRDTQNQEHQ